MRLRSAFFVGLLVFLPLAGCGTGAEEPADSKGAGLVQIAQTLEGRGEIGSAVDFYRRALAAEPRNGKALKGLTRLMEQFGDRQAAAALYREGVAARPKDGELRRGYGKILIALDNPGEAKRQFDAALSLDGDDAKARVGLAVALDYLGEHKKAQKEYEKVLAAEPENMAATNNLAYSYILSRRYERAIKLLEPLYDKPSATPALRQNLALAYGLAGMEMDAERISRIDLAPEKVRANMDYYRRQRAEMRIEGANPYAELGTYATEAMAIAQIHRLQADIDRAGGNLRPVVLPELSSPGGTPRFTVRMMGCSKPSDVSRLCKTLAQSGIPCVARGKGAEE